MKLRAILLLVFLSYGSVNGQLILTVEENTVWVSKLKDEKDLAEQLRIVRARILADTNVFVQGSGDRIILPTGKDAEKEQGLCHPLLIVEGHAIQTSNTTDNNTVKALTKELTTDRIKQLEVVDAEKAKALFGQNAWCGVILLVAKNKKARKELLKYKI